MKTGHEYLAMMPEDVREKFLANLGKYQDAEIFLQDTWNSFQLFIVFAFSWIKTTEGASYWNEISQMKID